MAPNFQMGLLTEDFAFEYFSLKWAKMRAIHFKRSISFEYVLLMDKHEQNTQPCLSNAFLSHTSFTFIFRVATAFLFRI